MADFPEGYKDIPEEDRKRSVAFFDRGRTVADTGNYEYAIEMYLQGLSFDPDATDAHQAIREISLRRKSIGGKPLGMTERWKLKKGDDKQNMLNAEKLLAYDPGNTEHMVTMLASAQKGGFFDTVLWLGPILFRANSDLPKPDTSKYRTLKEVYNAIGEYRLAIEALAAAMRARPEDMTLQQELKDLSAKSTIKHGNYDSGKSFRESIRDMEGQKKLMDADKDVRSLDALEIAVRDAEADFQKDPADISNFAKLVDALVRTEQMDQENRAIELLEQRFQETRQFKFRQRVGQIKVSQLGRMDRALREELAKNPTDAEMRKQYQQFARDRAAEELQIWQEISAAYPTDTQARYEVGRRLYVLGQHNEAIPVLQQVRNDPKYRITAGTLLGRAFLEAGFAEEAVDTLQGVIGEYPGRGDERSTDLYYWYGRSAEAKGDRDTATKSYSQVAQWNFNYKDVQARIKRLRTPPTVPPQPEAAQRK